MSESLLKRGCGFDDGFPTKGNTTVSPKRKAVSLLHQRLQAAEAFAVAVVVQRGGAKHCALERFHHTTCTPTRSAPLLSTMPPPTARRRKSVVATDAAAAARPASASTSECR